jgi:hypothetical protein
MSAGRHFLSLANSSLGLSRQRKFKESFLEPLYVADAMGQLQAFTEHDWGGCGHLQLQNRHRQMPMPVNAASVRYRRPELIDQLAACPEQRYSELVVREVLKCGSDVERNEDLGTLSFDLDLESVGDSQPVSGLDVHEDAPLCPSANPLLGLSRQRI